MTDQTWDLPGAGEHADWDALAVGWALSALEPEDEARVRAHLPTCPRCSETVRDAVRTVIDLAYAVPDETPPRHLKRRILEAAAAEPRRPASAPADAPEPPAGSAGADRVGGEVVPLTPRRRRWLTGAAAAGVAVLAGLGAWNVQLRNEQAELRSQQAELRQFVAERDALVQRLTEPGEAEIAVISAPGGERQATVVVKDDRLSLITETLPRRPGEGTYWLWSLRGPTDPDPVPLAGLNVPESKLSACNIELPAGLETRAFAISEEPGLAKPATPTKVVGLGETDTGG